MKANRLRKKWGGAEWVAIILVAAFLLKFGYSFYQNSLNRILISSVRDGSETYGIRMLQLGADPNANYQVPEVTWITDLNQILFNSTRFINRKECVLETAVRFNLNKLVRELLAQGADHRQMSWANHCTLLMTAASCGNSENTKRLMLKGVIDLNERDSSSMPLLMMMADKKLEESAIQLLKLGADPSICNAVGQDALCVAADKHELRLARELLDRDVNPNHCPPAFRPLSIAAARGHKDMVNLLLSRGAQPNREAIKFAAGNRHTELAAYLTNKMKERNSGRLNVNQ